MLSGMTSCLNLGFGLKTMKVGNSLSCSLWTGQAAGYRLVVRRMLGGSVAQQQSRGPRALVLSYVAEESQAE